MVFLKQEQEAEKEEQVGVHSSVVAGETHWGPSGKASCQCSAGEASLPDTCPCLTFSRT